MKKGKVLTIFVILIWCSFIAIAIRTIAYPGLKIGDNVSTNKVVVPIELSIVQYDGVDLYLYDSVRNNLYIYSEGEEYKIVFKFVSPGSMIITEINELDEYFVIGSVGNDTFYKVDFGGEVLAIKYGDYTYQDELQHGSYYLDYRIKNRVLWYTILKNEEVIKHQVSWVPVIIIGITIFFIGMFSSVKQIGRTRNENNE